LMPPARPGILGIRPIQTSSRGSQHKYLKGALKTCRQVMSPVGVLASEKLLLILTWTFRKFTRQNSFNLDPIQKPNRFSEDPRIQKKERKTFVTQPRTVTIFLDL